MLDNYCKHTGKQEKRNSSEYTTPSHMMEKPMKLKRPKKQEQPRIWPQSSVVQQDVGAILGEKMMAEQL